MCVYVCGQKLHVALYTVMLYGRWSVSDSAVFVCICVCGQQLHVALYTVMLQGQWSVSDSAVFMCTQLLGSEIQRTAFVGLRVRR